MTDGLMANLRKQIELYLRHKKYNPNDQRCPGICDIERRAGLGAVAAMNSQPGVEPCTEQRRGQQGALKLLAVQVPPSGLPRIGSH